MNFKYYIDERPAKNGEMIILSLQHVFAMFGSTVLVPILIGIDVSVALFTAGMGTLLYSLATKAKVPVFIGSSFAYIGILSLLVAEYGQNYVSLAVMSVGLIYILLSFLIRAVGTSWLDYILPPVVMGPVIIVIGLSLASTAISSSGLGIDAFDQTAAFISLSTLLVTAIAMMKGNNFSKSIPILIGIAYGYIVSLIFGLVDLAAFSGLSLISVPKFYNPFIAGEFEFSFGVVAAIIPLVFVTVAEHIGDHTVSSTITGKNFLKDPGLDKTLLGDGLATLFAGLVGGPVNTTYAENTGVIILTRVASVAVIRLAAVFAMIIAFLSPINTFINSIPAPVMGGISIALFGLIAQNGVKLLVAGKVDFNHPRNMMIIAVILIIGLGGALITFTIATVKFEFTTMSLAALVGIFFHLVLPEKEASLTKK
ncbi:solute carrier family 23 protein [Mollicutes bacterium LVI A0039]|nr:solute carrier family 23 protein [Mollicutes bacterium LVI A0039]